MLNWWLATLSLFGFLAVSIALVLFALKESIHSEDSYRIDPLPNQDDSDSDEK
ncbi:hypothetical protein [Bacillus weihaiensis]|uniref:hypothetical protein n=1 Tax=Bacillus weihaiensis TaxID=1547283 RepID=UPI001313F3A1|nr:hypothetical protein [Bacillus weihaiensis]